VQYRGAWEQPVGDGLVDRQQADLIANALPFMQQGLFSTRDLTARNLHPTYHLFTKLGE
jgi:hypothetical protein